MTCAAAVQSPVYPEASLYIWDARVAVGLRRNHRIVGALIGTSFGHMQQNADLEVPLELNPYEAGLVLERGWLTSSCTLSGLQDGAAAEARARLDAAEPASDWKQALKGGVAYTMPVPSQQPGAQPWGSTAQGAVLSAEQQLRLRRRHIVFRDLYDRGFHVTSGHKFGGDFLCYQGDPHLFHAQYTVRVQHDMDKRSAVILSASRRGALGAKKHVLLAEVLFEVEGCSDSDKPRVVYHNIEKSGVVGAPEELVLMAGDLNSKLYRTMET